MTSLDFTRPTKPFPGTGFSRAPTAGRGRRRDGKAACALAARRRVAGWLVATALLVGVWAACGGGGGSPPPPIPSPAPIVTLSSTSINFGQVRLGSGSATQTVTLTNAGNGALTLGSVGATSGDYADFTDTWQTCFNAVLPAGGTCGVTLEFVPQATGMRTAPYAFNDNAAGSPQTVSLSGTGVQPPTPPGTYSIQVQAVSGSDSHYSNVPVYVQ